MIEKLKNTDWYPHLEAEFTKDYFKNLDEFINQEYDGQLVFPAKDQIFNALFQTPLKDVKVVILGQDPYHGVGQAHGLAFSVLDNVKPPPSLVNIFKELETDLGVVPKKSGNLDYWAKQGVLLLNNTLTVRSGEAGSHQKKGWEIFTQKIIEIINEKSAHTVFILWGLPAQKKASFVNRNLHFVIESPHPSPLSSYRGFFGSKPFSQTNNYLKSFNLKPIDW